MSSIDASIVKDLELYKSITKGALGSIPIIGGVVVELWNYLDARLIEERITRLEEKVHNHNIAYEQFKDRLLGISGDEHRFYAIRNNLKHMCLTALPETVDALNTALIELIMSDNYDMPEHACELIQQLNADDIVFIRRLVAFKANGKRTYQEKAAEDSANTIQAYKENEIKNKTREGYKPRVWVDRHITFENNTVFWKDFAEFFGIPSDIDPGQLMNVEARNSETGESFYSLAYIALSLVKLQNLGVLVIEFTGTMGVSSPLNVNRFHITHFGQKLISYIEPTKAKE